MMNRASFLKSMFLAPLAAVMGKKGLKGVNYRFKHGLAARKGYTATVYVTQAELDKLVTPWRELGI